MLYPSINDLLQITENRYILVNQVAKRARQIVEGSNCLVETKELKPVSMATIEVFQGEISYLTRETEEKDEIREMMDLASLEASFEQEEEML